MPQDEHKPIILPYEGVMPDVARAAYIAPGASLIGNVILGDGANIWFGAVLRGDINKVVVGDRTNVQDGCILHVTEDLAVVLDEDVTMGHGAIVHAAYVGPRSMIAMHATVLDGSVIGEECIIAAGCVVAPGKKIPPRSLVAGVPGRIVRQVTDEEIANMLVRAREYVELGKRYAEK